MESTRSSGSNAGNPTLNKIAWDNIREIHDLSSKYDLSKLNLVPLKKDLLPILPTLPTMSFRENESLNEQILIHRFGSFTRYLQTQTYNNLFALTGIGLTLVLACSSPVAFGDFKPGRCVIARHEHATLIDRECEMFPIKVLFTTFLSALMTACFATCVICKYAIGEPKEDKETILTRIRLATVR